MYTETETARATLTCPPTGAILPGPLGPNRVREFNDSNKFRVLDQVTLNAVGKNAVPVYQLDLDLFQALLRKFKREDYNGIRAYFACYPDEPTAEERSYVPAGMEGQLTLLFVPTSEDPGARETGIDDTDKFWHIGTDGQLNFFTLPFATNWIRHYRQNRMNLLELDGKTATGNPDFDETRSHWYNLDIIAGNGGNDPGLISYINCARQQAVNPVTELYIQWAAFLDSDNQTKYPKYQLSIIFYLRQEKDPPPNKDNMFPIANPIVFGSLMGEAADTGLPCPPLTYCPGSGISPDL